jgi:hypothetical protein
MNTEAQMVLTVRMGREVLEQFEPILRSKELSAGMDYTPDVDFIDHIRKDYAMMA